MREGFFGLNIAVSGLYTAQKNLDIINHNLSNVNTPGYSRQQAVQVASRPMALLDGTGMMGTGSDITGVNRIRDEYLDFKYWSEVESYGEWDSKRTLLTDLEATFNEPSNSGFTKILDEFYSSLQELSKDPSSTATRALVREKGVTIAKYFNSISAHFEKLQSDVNYNVKTKVEEINSLATQIQQINRQIFNSELDGSIANDLRDQRGALVDRLSKIVNIDANEVIVGKLPSGRDDKRFVITISGKALVDHFNISKLDVKQRKTKLNEEDIDNLYQVGWADGNTLDVKSGELKGYLDVRDGNDGDNVSPTYKGIPHYIKKINQFVRTFAMAFNEGYVDSNTNEIIEAGEDGAGHADGYRLDSVAGDPPSGIRFFTMLDPEGNEVDSATFIDGASTVPDICDRYKKKITAKNFAVSEDVMSDYNTISTSSKSGEKGNIENLNALLDMRHSGRMFSEGAPEDFMKSMVSTLGIDSQQALRLSDNQQIIVKQLDNRRTSISGVSIDEEMTNLVKHQQVYNASAKMINTIMQVYDTLINKVGVR